MPHPGRRGNRRKRLRPDGPHRGRLGPSNSRPARARLLVLARRLAAAAAFLPRRRAVDRPASARKSAARASTQTWSAGSSTTIEPWTTSFPRSADCRPRFDRRVTATPSAWASPSSAAASCCAQTDVAATRLNALISGHISAAMTPAGLRDRPRDAIAAFSTIGLAQPPQAKFLWIADTLHLSESRSVPPPISPKPSSDRN